MSRLIPGLITIIVAAFIISMDKAFATSTHQPSSLESYKSALKQMGLPDDDFILEYLVHEIFYNTPYRDRVANSIDEVKVHDLKLPVNENNFDVFSNIFDLKHMSAKTIYLNVRCVRISGHNSYFCWSPSNPKAYFIFKNRYVGINALAVSTLLYSAWRTDPRIAIDFPLETAYHLQPDEAETISIISPLSIKPFPNIRRLSTYKMTPKHYIYPLHGFLNSPKLSEIAQKSNVSEFDWFRTKLMPELAQTFFAFHNIIGIHLAQHTQNLWLLYNPDSNEFHLAAKDFSDGYINPLVASRHLNKWAKATSDEYINYFYPIIWRTNSYFIHENPRAHEPSFNFISYGYQSVALSHAHSFHERSLLVKAFFENYIDLVRKHFAVPFTMSASLNDVWRRLDSASHDIDLRVSIPDGKTIGGRIVGLQAFSELLMREIFDHINSILIGQRHYPKSKSAQEALDTIFRHQMDYGVDLCRLEPNGIGPLGQIPEPKLFLEKAQNKVHTCLDPIRQSWFQIKTLLKGRSHHYEYTARHILLVDTLSNKVITLIPRPKWFQPAALETHSPICLEVLTGPYIF